MSTLIHIQTKHIVEYGASNFNHKQMELYKLLKDNGCSINCGDEYDDEWEIEENEFKKVVKKIGRLSEEKISSYGLNETKEEILKTLNTFLKTGDHSDGYYHLSWF